MTSAGLERVLRGPAALLFLGGCWQGASLVVPEENRWLLPGPLSVLAYLWNHLPDFGAAAGSTLVPSLVGFAAGAGAGFALAVIFHLLPAISRAALPVVSTLPAVPIVAIAPLIVLWLGFGLSSRVFIVAFITFFPILVTVLTGLSQGYPSQREYLEMQSVPLGTRFLYMDLPASLAFLGAGIRTAAPLAVVGAIVAEYVAPKAGLGYLVITYALRTDVTGTMAAALTCASLGLLFSAAAGILGRSLERVFPGE